jgi:predicted amidohydrolase YtcJ
MPEAQRIFFGGPIITMEPGQPRAEAVAIADGRILAVGTRAEIEAHAGARTERIDLEGATLLPGFVEAHSHPLMSAMAWGDPVVDVRAVHTPTYAAVLEKMRRRIAKAAPGEIVWFLGLDAQLHAGMEEPARELLDEIAPDHAIAVQTINFHAVFLNSKALEVFGIGPGYTLPLGGEVVAGADGRPWKFKETAAWQLCNRFYKILGEERKVRSFDEWVAKFVRAGYTTTSEIMIEPGAAPMLAAAVRSRRNPLRIVGYEGVHRGGAVTVRRDNGDDDFRVIGTKLHADGSVLLGNVWTTHPYLNNAMTLKGMGLPPDNTGHASLSAEKTCELVSKYVKEGWQMSVHAHGDRTIDMVLDAYEKVLAETADVNGPLRIEHCGMMREDQIDRAIRLGVVCSYFLPYIYNWGEALRDYLLGEEAAARFVPSGSAIRKGMRTSFHCDSPMTWPDALVCLHVAVTRRTMKGAVIGPEQRVGIDEALKAVTIDAAHQLQMEDRIGSIAPGKYADFVILSQDPTACDPERLLEISILGTLIAGERTDSFFNVGS